MSEYQFVAFRAIDNPLSDKDLAYMKRQSSRAEITRWSFENEYHYGDFRGNALEMLRRGYDIHFHFADFGIRTLMIRLPNGLPDEKTVKHFFSAHALKLHKDKRGKGVIVEVNPFAEPDDWDYLDDIEEMIDDLAPLRAEMMSGDLRPFYLAHLAMVSDENHAPETSHEGPVPFGLKKLTNAQLILAELYELGDAFLSAAAAGIPEHALQGESTEEKRIWLKQQSASKKDRWLEKLVSDVDANVRSEIEAEYQSSRSASKWPVIERGRTIAELSEIAEQIQAKTNVRAAHATERRKAKRLADAAANPASILQQIDELISSKSNTTAEPIVKLLSELRAAQANTDRASYADEHAAKLKAAHPGRRMLIRQLKEAVFLKKKK